jgi:hypothetical protein
MGSIVNQVTGGLLGGGASADGSGVNFRATPATINNPIDPQSLANSNDASKNALAQQQAFLQAVQGQNGLGNQSSIFNQLQGVSNGTGPNPAQAMLANSTGQNVAQQAALMAGQRGSNQNAGLMARQAAQQGAGIQQQAAGQGAALQANQSLNALNSMGGIANQQAAQQASATNANSANNLQYQNQLLNANAGVNSANVANQSNVNNVNGSIASGVAGQQGNMLGNIVGSLGSAGQLFGGGAGGGASSALMGGALTSGLASGAGAATAGGAADGIMAAAPLLLAANGGMATKQGLIGPQSKVGQHFKSGGKAMFAKGGPVHSKVPALVSPGEVYLDPKAVSKVAKGADPIKSGEKIPGKAKVAGNSYANDIVHKNLAEGGIVLPKSVMESKSPHMAAKRFVEEVMKKKAALPRKG